VITNLIQSGSSFEVALDLIGQASDLVNTKLDGVIVIKGYQRKLKDLQAKC